jgi:formylglycine-generating enzyme required for sulfatase activity
LVLSAWQLIVFAVTTAILGGAAADFFAPALPLNGFLCLGTLATALLLLAVFSISRSTGLGLASLCLFILATGFGSWWFLAEYKGNGGRGFLASQLRPFASLQAMLFPPNENEQSPSSATAKDSLRFEPSTVEASVAIDQPKLITNSIGMKLAYIPAGEFLMGSPDSEMGREPCEGPQHKVKITRPFYMGIYECRQCEYEAVMHDNPSKFKSPDNPVERVLRSEAVEFCQKLSQLSGETDAGRRYRLPTEAEWEYACRAGTTTAFNCGDTLTPREANYNTFDSLGKPITRIGPVGKTTTVGSYSPNAWGLYDMHGNVWEWVLVPENMEDYSHPSEEDPQANIAAYSYATRGGAWWVGAQACRSANRGGAGKPANQRGDPYFRDQIVGFRVIALVIDKNAQTQVAQSPPQLQQPPSPKPDLPLPAKPQTASPDPKKSPDAPAKKQEATQASGDKKSDPRIDELTRSVVAAHIKDLESKKAADRIKAAQALAELGHQAGDARQALCDAMLDERPAVRTAVSLALEKVDGKLQKYVLALVVERNGAFQKEALKGLARLGEDGKPAMSVILAYAAKNAKMVTFGFTSSLNSVEVIRALMAIAPDDKRVFSLLVACLQSDNIRRRHAVYASQFEAINALPRTPFQEDSVKLLSSLLRLDEHEQMRAAAATALGEFGADAKSAVKYLEAAKVDSSSKVREAANAALAKIVDR